MAVIPNYFMKEEDATIVVIGAGGNGSHFLRSLAAYDYALQSLDHPKLKVKVWDMDVVEEHNIGRQAFGKASIDFNKAVNICSRINNTYGFEYEAYPKAFSPSDMWPLSGYTIFVLAVDSLEFRQEFFKYTEDFTNTDISFMDLGNGNDFGQVVFLPNPDFKDEDYWKEHLEHIFTMKSDPDADAISCKPPRKYSQTRVIPE